MYVQVIHYYGATSDEVEASLYTIKLQCIGIGGKMVGPQGSQ